jgi:outer membrane protein
MKKQINLLLALGFVAFTTNAQSKNETYTLTAVQAVDLALKNAVDIKNAKLDYQIQDARNKEIVGTALPQITGSASGSYYTNLPLIQFPDATEANIYKVLSDQGVKDGSGNPIQPKNSFGVNNVSFAAPWNMSYGFQIQQLLFQPDVFVGLQARKTALEYAENNIKVNEDKAKEQTYKAYYQVLIAEKQLTYLQTTIKRLEKLLSDQEQLFKNGFAEKLDIDKTTVVLNNTRTTENQLKNGIGIGYAALKLALSVSQKDSLVLSDTLSNDLVKEDLLSDVEKFNYTDRNEIKVLGKAKELQQLDMKRYKLGYIPTVAAFYSFTRSGQKNDQYAAITGGGWFWFNTGLIGLNVSIPIFDGFQKKHKITQSSLNIQKLDNTIANVQRAIDFEQTITRSNLRNAILNMDAQNRNMQLAERVYNTTKKKYEQGLGNSFELLQTDTELQRSIGNYFQALYDAVIAKISFQKSLGKL